MFGVSEQQLRNVGLYRPFYPASAAEVNHVQLVGGAGGGGVGTGGGARGTRRHRLSLWPDRATGRWPDRAKSCGQAIAHH